MKKKNIWIGLGLAALVTGSVLTIFSCRQNKPTFTFETAIAGKGNLNNSVTATGTLEAIKTVDVGTQVSGVILRLHADFNTYVKKGQLLAELDKTPLLASREEALASVADSDAELVYQESNYTRIKALYDKQLVAQTDFDLATYNVNKAKANKISVQARLDRAEINLKYATICSPIDGVVLNRAVNEGQTVAASFNTPTLFTIANDLTQMQVQADIDEADIGKVKFGQRVEFTVDAYPEILFPGQVSEVRIQPVVTSSVVTYTVIVNAPNPGSMLMPGMTASITVYTDEMQGAITIPGKALRFNPDQGLLADYFQSVRDSVPLPATMAVAPSASAEGSQVWVREGALIRPVKVETGLDNGSMVEVRSGLKEGDEVILAMEQSVPGGNGKAEASARSPFMPTRPGAKKQ